MDATSYCNTMAEELSSWKGKIEKVFLDLDRAPCEKKEKISPQVNDIHIIVTELEGRIEALRRDCPTDWESQKQELDTKLGQVRKKWAVLNMMPPGRRSKKTNL